MIINEEYKRLLFEKFEDLFKKYNIKYDEELVLDLKELCDEVYDNGYSDGVYEGYE